MIEGVQSFNDLVALWATYAVAALALVGAVTVLKVALKWIQDLSERASGEWDHPLYGSKEEHDFFEK